MIKPQMPGKARRVIVFNIGRRPHKEKNCVTDSVMPRNTRRLIRNNNGLRQFGDVPASRDLGSARVILKETGISKT